MNVALVLPPIRPRSSLRIDSQPLADCQPETGARDIPARQPLDGLKDLAMVCRVDSDSVVRHRNPPFIVCLFEGDVNMGSELTPIFDRIGEKVLKQQDKVRMVTADNREVIAPDDGVAFVYGGLEISLYAAQHSV